MGAPKLAQHRDKPPAPSLRMAQPHAGDSKSNTGAQHRNRAQHRASRPGTAPGLPSPHAGVGGPKQLRAPHRYPCPCPSIPAAVRPSSPASPMSPCWDTWAGAHPARGAEQPLHCLHPSSTPGCHSRDAKLPGSLPALPVSLSPACPTGPGDSVPQTVPVPVPQHLSAPVLVSPALRALIPTVSPCYSVPSVPHVLVSP